MATKPAMTEANAFEAATAPEPAEGDSVAPCARRQRMHPIVVTSIVAIVIAATYAGYQRFGTEANADVIEYTRNLSGGFVALAMTETQPGFIALSALEREKVTVAVLRSNSALAGTHTEVEVTTPGSQERFRLRGPKVLMISRSGGVDAVDVDWTFDEFHALREAMDCSSFDAAMKKHRCGQPFMDLVETLVNWSPGRVPHSVIAFLAPSTERETLLPFGDRLEDPVNDD